MGNALCKNLIRNGTKGNIPHPFDWIDRAFEFILDRVNQLCASYRDLDRGKILLQEDSERISIFPFASTFSKLADYLIHYQYLSPSSSIALDDIVSEIRRFSEKLATIPIEEKDALSFDSNIGERANFTRENLLQYISNNCIRTYPANHYSDNPHLDRNPNLTHIAFIYNAGICLQGSSRENMIRSLFINTLLPIVTGLLALLYYYHEIILQEMEQQLTVLFVSSGDGERIMIHSKVIEEIDTIHSLTGLCRYMNKLVDEFDDEMEFAFGPSPMYSLSKLLMNKSMLLLQQEVGNINEKVGKNKKHGDMRCISVCPGNFLSSMSTKEELEEEQAVSVEIAADYVSRLVLDFNEYPGGAFYRFGRQIEW